ncbi:MAG: glutathione S-transferase [Betaproteobacteria bacterium]|nr:glutathione S-transferase [Betaproteobacteria bacterium]
MLKIWGRKNSINVQKVLWCCGEIGLKYERVDAGMQFGVVNTPEYRKLNPNGLVPTIEDDGFVLWESHAIVRYLARRHSRGKLWPENDKACADADRWMDWYNTTVWPNMRTVFWNLVRVPPEKRDVAAVEEARKKLAESFAIADAQLAGNAYLAGKEFTMGDIPMGVAAYRWFNLPIERPAHRNVERWYQRICERPAYKEHCMLPLT